jgi:tetratricopeptide (TPR) repeat protein
MTHTPVVINTKIEYYDFEMNGMDGPQQYPTVGLPTYSGEKIKERIKENEQYAYCIKSVTPIHQGVLDYMGDNMSVGGTSPTCGIVVHWEQTCCGVRQVYERVIMVQEEKRKIPGNWTGWATSYRNCGDLKNAVSILKVAHSRFPDYTGIIYNLACYSCMLENFDSAKDYLKKAIEMDNKYEEMSKNDIDLFPLFTCYK